MGKQLIGSLCAFFLLCSDHALGNDLVFSNVLLGTQDLTNNTQELSFDVAWDNSWRTSTLENNHDAVWVFVKYRLDGSTEWHHATLQGSLAALPSGAELMVTSDGMGVFVQRDSDGIGDVTFAGCTVLWDRAADGVTSSTIAEVCAFGIEMVHVPSGSYHIGDGSQSPVGMLGDVDSLPFTVADESELFLGGTDPDAMITVNTAGQSVADDITPTTPQTLPVAYPKGTVGFYHMKYEVDQGLYAAMLGKLLPAQATARYPGTTANGHTISNSSGNYTAGVPDRACNFLDWNDIAALADWAGLRPMSEMEYEKAARGDRPALSDELAHGDVNASTTAHVITDPGLPTETVNAQALEGNFVYLTVQTASRPLRTGIMAATAPNSTRLETGGSRYGAMEMSGNLWETVVSIGGPEGRSFTAVEGDGELDPAGDANVTTWPATDALGTGIRGGGLFSSVDKLRISDRSFSNLALTTRQPDIGARLVRSNL